METPLESMKRLKKYFEEKTNPVSAYDRGLMKGLEYVIEFFENSQIVFMTGDVFE